MDTHADRHSETTPLLQENGGDEPDQQPNLRAQAQRLLLLVCVSIVAIDFGSYLSYAPQIEIFESIICRRLHSSGLDFVYHANNSTSVCKSDDVQSELALLVGWNQSFNQLPGILLALPYGLMADRVGRKTVLLLSLIGLLMEEVVIRMIVWWSDFIPLRVIWLAPLFQIAGGGPQIATSMAYTMISDVFPAERKSSIFFLLAAVILLGEILATPISAVLMSYTPWLPSLLGIAFEVIGLAAAALVTETLPKSSKVEDDEREQGPGQHSVSGDQDGWAAQMSQRWNRLRHSHYDFSLSMNLFLIIGAFILASIGTQALQLVIQYASKRFSWSIAEASFLVTIKGIVNLVLLLVLLPRLSLILGKHMPTAIKDLIIVQGSAWMLALGTAIMAFATHPGLFIVGICTFALGWGFYSALRSMATAIVSPSQTGVLNTTIALSQSMGSMAAGPLLALAFRRGIELGGVWTGLPYMIATVLFVGASILVWGMRIPRLVDDAESASLPSDLEPT
ncbi:Efflux pump ustT [Cladobotryum mycophilum]|uniref:Efflux pump ustT n=1 Tax=Cladobotryum mycophilum TaxID=491253 RepID=A0ABR0SA34_9HYPO